MAIYKVQRFGTVGHAIQIDTGDALTQADVVALIKQAFQTLTVQESQVIPSANPTDTSTPFWERIQEIPQNIVELAALDTFGYLERLPDGTFITSQEPRVSAAISLFGDGEDGENGLDGLPGLPGAPGTDGADGLPGMPGLDGDDGEDGLPGLPGAPGTDGADGLPGMPGLDGDDGEDGLPGLPGAPGTDGADGLPGMPGLDGDDGEDGLPGVAGPQGLPGVDGIDGLIGLPGDDGEDGLDGIPGTQGPPGETGAPGYTLIFDDYDPDPVMPAVNGADGNSYEIITQPWVFANIATFQQNVYLGSASSIIVSTTNREFMALRGTAGAALEFQTAAADAASLFMGCIQWADASSSSLAGKIRCILQGTTSSDRGGELIFSTKLNGSSGSSSLIDYILLDNAGNFVLNGTGVALATTATGGFTHLPSCAGVPTGAPTTYAGAAPFVFDSTDNRLYAYNGAWKNLTAISANPSATIGLSAVNGTAATFMTSDSAPALSQAIAPTWTGVHTFKPTSGVISITAVAGSDALDLYGQIGRACNMELFSNGTTTNGLLVGVNSGGSAYFNQQAAGIFQILTNNIVRITAAATGGITIAAPTSGDAFTVTNVSGANALVVNGIAAGTPVIRVNTQATTGAKTASMTASNKPGTNNQTTPATWLPVILDGTTYYVPCYAA